jgi:hypothetical protein
VSIHPWKLFFDASVCREGQGVGVIYDRTTSEKRDLLPQDRSGDSRQCENAKNIHMKHT